MLKVDEMRLHAIFIVELQGWKWHLNKVKNVEYGFQNARIGFNFCKINI